MFGVCVLRHAERRGKNVVKIQNVTVCTGTTRTYVTTCARGAGTHGDVLNLDTGDVLKGHTWCQGSSPVLLTRICPRMVLTCFRGSPKKLLDLSHFQV